MNLKIEPEIENRQHQTDSWITVIVKYYIKNGM